MTDIIKNSDKASLCAQFVETVKTQVGKGVYVWGGNGELLDGMRALA